MEKFKKHLPKLIFLVLGIIIAVEALYVFKAFRETSPLPAKLQVRPIGDAQLVLASNKKAYQVGEKVQVQIRVDTGGHPTVGADVNLTFDPKVLEASGSAIKIGQVYDSYPLVAVDGKAGTIKIGAVSDAGEKGFNGVGILATLEFKAKAAGQANLNFEFKPGVTSDSNVTDVKKGQDLLGKVTNLEVVVK